MSLACEVEIVALGLVPEEVPGSETFGSNGLALLTPLTPKTDIQVAPESEIERVAVIEAALRGEEAIAYHSSTSNVELALVTLPRVGMGITPLGGYALILPQSTLKFPIAAA